MDARSNLDVSLRIAHPRAEIDRYVELMNFLQRERGQGIVYASDAACVDRVFAFTACLGQRDIAVGRCHDKMSARDRREIRERFQRGVVRVMIATHGLVKFAADYEPNGEPRFIVDFDADRDLAQTFRHGTATRLLVLVRPGLRKPSAHQPRRQRADCG